MSAVTNVTKNSTEHSRLVVYAAGGLVSAFCYSVRCFYSDLATGLLRWLGRIARFIRNPSRRFVTLGGGGRSLRSNYLGLRRNANIVGYQRNCLISRGLVCRRIQDAIDEYYMAAARLLKVVMATGGVLLA